MEKNYVLDEDKETREEFIILKNYKNRVKRSRRKINNRKRTDEPEKSEN